MSAAQNEAAVHRLYDELNNNNLDVIDEILAPDFKAHGETMGLQPGQNVLEAMKQGIMWVKMIMPDLKVTVEDTVSEGNRVACRLQFAGTHTGTDGNIPATNNRVEYAAIAINRFENGQIAERWFTSDELGMMRQMGLIPPIGQ
jgi:predicted ester cyclase